MSTTWSRGTVMQELMQPLHPSHRYTQTCQTICQLPFFMVTVSSVSSYLFVNASSKHTNPCTLYTYLIPIFIFYQSTACNLSPYIYSHVTVYIYILHILPFLTDSHILSYPVSTNVAQSDSLNSGQ